MRQSPHPQPESFECVALPTFPAVRLFRDEDGSLKSLDEIEREVIRFHIEHHRGQMSAVARSLGIGRSTLYRKLDSDIPERAPKTCIG